MILHFYCNESMRYKDLRIGAHWFYLKEWQQFSHKKNIEIRIGPSPNEKKLAEYRHQFTEKEHDIPDQHRTVLEIDNSGKYIYFDAQDYHDIGAELSKVPDLFDLCIKMQYREGSYDNIPFKVVPFTYYAPNGHERLMRYREKRLKVLDRRAFNSSVLWAGHTSKMGLRNRKSINKYLVQKTKMSKHGRWSFETYYKNISEALVGASARGIGDFCHRDIEFMGVGTPFFRKEFKNSTRNSIIPNVHYYTIGGDEVGIDKTLKHFCDHFEPNGELLVMSDDQFDHYMTMCSESMRWYDQNAAPEASLQLLLDILEENNCI